MFRSDELDGRSQQEKFRVKKMQRAVGKINLQFDGPMGTYRIRLVSEKCLRPEAADALLTIVTGKRRAVAVCFACLGARVTVGSR